MSRKGPSFERDVCRQLSLWWTSGKNDWVFWRSASSGAFATCRAKKGKRTKGHCGDICAVDPIGESFTKSITLECKNGYPRTSVHDLMDRNQVKSDDSVWGFIRQAEAAAGRAGTTWWWLVWKRNGTSEPLLFMPSRISDYLGLNKKLWYYARFKWKDHADATVIAVRLKEFLDRVDPSDLEGL